MGLWEGDDDAVSDGATLAEADVEAGGLLLEDALTVEVGVPRLVLELLGELLGERESSALPLGEGVSEILADALPEPLGEVDGKGLRLAPGENEEDAV